MRKLIMSTITGAVAFALMTGASVAQTLRVGVEGNYPPFSMIAPDGKLSGFDIDIANALCAEMKVTCTMVQQEWDGMIPALNAKKFDIIVASMTITEERRQRVDFTNPYYDVPSRWVAKKGAFKDHSADALRGKTIVVLRNSPRARFVAANYPNSTVLLVAKETEVYMELAAGRGDIGFGSSVVSSEAFLKRPEGANFEQVGDTVVLDRTAGAGVGIALRKGEDDLRNRLNAALATIRSNGVYDGLAKKYFDFPVAPQG